MQMPKACKFNFQVNKNDFVKAHSEHTEVKTSDCCRRSSVQSEMEYGF